MHAEGYDDAFANFWGSRSIFYSEVFDVEVFASVSASLPSVSATWTYERNFVYSAVITVRRATSSIRSVSTRLHI